MSLVSDQSELSIVTIDQSEASIYLMMDMERTIELSTCCLVHGNKKLCLCIYGY